MKFICFTIALFLISCGGHTKVKYHVVPTRAELHNVCLDASEGLEGCAKTEDDLNIEVICDVYMMPVELYPSQECYNAVLEHERKHCYKFHWHPPGPTPDIVSVCLTSQPTYTFEIGK